MTKEEYFDYRAAVVKNMEPYERMVSTGDKVDDFSKAACECCGRPLAGERYKAEATEKETGDRVLLSVCVDCVYFLEYGCLDDMTMMEIDYDQTKE